MNGKHEFGDYQTPLDFAKRICCFLKTERNIAPSVVLDPTCGIGNFLKASLAFQSEKYYGIEINEQYCHDCSTALRDEKVEVIHADLFQYDLQRFRDMDRILVVGNPPWATNSALSAALSGNLPIKSNFKGLKGLEAVTGASNFDICEFMILKLVGAFQNTHAVIAMLCKTSVARNVFLELKRRNISFSECEIITFDAYKVFRIHAAACLLLVRLCAERQSSDMCRVSSLEDQGFQSSLRYQDGLVYSGFLTSRENFDGKCRFEWRQGVKHDCSKVMELTSMNGTFFNGRNEAVEIESDLVFPLVKSSMFKAPVITAFSRYVIVTQKKIREDTGYIARDYPKTWHYLQQNLDTFQRRRSSIYRGAPQFSMFGVGDYSYAGYKVGISGFYKTPRFSLLFSPDGKPVMTDDTSYFLCFPSYETAYAAMLMLNSERVQDFLQNIAFSDAKRPYTKKVLQRIDFQKIHDTLTLEELQETESRLRLPPHVTGGMISDFFHRQ